MGPFNVTITVMVKKKFQTLNGLGHGWVFWARSYHYTITEQSRSISHTPAQHPLQHDPGGPKSKQDNLVNTQSTTDKNSHKLEKAKKHAKREPAKH